MNGTKRGEGLFEDGVREGKVVKYYRDGKVSWERNCVNGEIEGKWVSRDWRDGTIIDQNIYKDGECVEMC